jgi:hypothetical protein
VRSDSFIEPMSPYTGVMVDTTFDTTQSATRRNGWQPPAKKSAYLSCLCNIRQRLETDDIGLWLRRSGVRAIGPAVRLWLSLVLIPL